MFHLPVLSIRKPVNTPNTGMFQLLWALSIYEKNPEISVVAKVEFPIGKKLDRKSVV